MKQPAQLAPPPDSAAATREACHGYRPRARNSPLALRRLQLPVEASTGRSGSPDAACSALFVLALPAAA